MSAIFTNVRNHVTSVERKWEGERRMLSNKLYNKLHNKSVSGSARHGLVVQHVVQLVGQHVRVVEFGH